MTMTSWCQIRSTATQASSAVFQGYRIGSTMGAPRGNIMLLSILAIALAILACHVTVPWIIYHWGAPKLADAQDVQVELEFEPEGTLKSYSRVDLRINEGKKSLVTATLRENRPKPGRPRDTVVRVMA